MNNATRASGIDAIGDIPWGSHFCQFYREEKDLAETLVPYFQAGLAANESCLWVTSQSLDADKAISLLSHAIPDLKRYLATGQMEVVSISDWYQPGDAFDADQVLNGWIEREQRSRANGFAGLRLTGDTIWVERSGWADFMDYEQKVNTAFRLHNLVALCTYCMDTCNASDVLDVCRHHQFALTRSEGTWEVLESSSLKLAKDQLMRLNGELEERVVRRTSALNTALRARDEFLAMLGHELRNPLAPIRTAAEVIHTLAPSGSAIADSAAILTRQANHLTRLVDDLLDAARITQGHIQIEKAPVALADIIELAVEQARGVIDARGHSLSIGVPSRAVHVNADPTRLAQVFGNLLNNAAKYTPDGGEVAISAKVVDGVASITVKDNGSGIPAPMLDEIFCLFTQLPRSLDRADGGLGIGLTLARRIVEMHGGTIGARSDGSDQGSAFTVTIATCEAKAAPARAPVPAAPVHAAASRILIVDDNVDAREAMATMMSLYGHEVHTAGDGAEALEQAAVLAPSLVILDIGLPDMNGYEVAQRMRALALTPAPKLVALTGYGQPSDVQRAHDAGFDAHLLKPAMFEDVMATVVRLTAQ